MIKALLFATLLAAPIAAYADDIHLHGHMKDGSVIMEMRNETTHQKMETTLTNERAHQLAAWLAKNGFAAQPPAAGSPPVKEGCGLGDFFTGKC